ncbi:hypothetical protein [Rhodococcus jostii]|uniref:hypothetical protein n=1 Tax=Rhodococcus jostii TaxID=132919 RepID=UPI003645E7B1
MLDLGRARITASPDAGIVLGFAVVLSVRDIGWPGEPPHVLHVGGRNYLHPSVPTDTPPTDAPYRAVGSVTPLPPFASYSILTEQGSGTPAIVYLQWRNGKYYSYGLSGGPDPDRAGPTGIRRFRSADSPVLEHLRTHLYRVRTGCALVRAGVRSDEKVRRRDGA